MQLLAVDDALDVGSDHELLVRGNDENLDLGILGGQAPSAVTTQGVAGMSLKKNHKLNLAVQLESTVIKNVSRYRVRSLPAAGALLKDEDRGEEQMSLIN